MSFSTSTTGNPGLSSEINITPLIDVLLVLLIIFMVIVPVLPHGLPSTSPSPAAAASADGSPERPVMVQVEQGLSGIEYVVDGTRIDEAQVCPRLVELLSRRSARSLLVKADAHLDFGVVAAVMDAGQRAGADAIGLVTPKAEGQPR